MEMKIQAERYSRYTFDKESLTVGMQQSLYSTATLTTAPAGGGHVVLQQEYTLYIIDFMIYMGRNFITQQF